MPFGSNHPSSPPLAAEPGSSDLSMASFAKVPGFFLSLAMSSLASAYLAIKM